MPKGKSKQQKLVKKEPEILTVPTTDFKASEELDPVEKVPGKYQNRKLVSNWSKYAEEGSDVTQKSDSKDEALGLTEDFASLAMSSVTSFNFFQLSSEKEWTTPYTNCNLFNLDLATLSKGLASIPFYERIGLDPSYLTDSDKKVCDRAAERNQLDYQSKTISNQNNIDEAVIKGNEEAVFIEDELEAWLDDVLGD